MNGDLLLAILAMDTDIKGVTPSARDASRNIGPTTFLKEETSDEAQAAGFYAEAFEVGSGVDGIEPGTIVISFASKRSKRSPASRERALVARDATPGRRGDRHRCPGCKGQPGYGDY